MRLRTYLTLLLGVLSLSCSGTKEEPPTAKSDITIVSGGAEVKPFEALFVAPTRAPGSQALKEQKRVPLLVVAHAWGQDIRTTDFTPILSESKRRAWAVLVPDLQHKTGQVGMCADDGTLARIEAAINFVKQKLPIDPNRVYLTGFNTGAWVSLRAAQKWPKTFAALSLWAPVGDLGHWLQELDARQERELIDLLNASCDLPDELRARKERIEQLSPSAQLDRLEGLNIGISVGVHDDQMISLSQSINLFERLSRINGEFTQPILPKDHAQIARHRRIPTRLEGLKSASSLMHKNTKVHLGTQGLNLSLFEGKHEVDVNALFSWLASMTR